MTPLGLTLRLLAFIVPIIIVGVLLWQVNARWQGVKIYRTAFDYELEYAKVNVLNSQVYVARAYDNGHQVEHDPAEAVKWWKKAAAQGHAEAQYQLGRHYLNGEGTPRNDAEGFRWVQKSAFKEYAEGELRTGQLLCEGRIVPGDCVRGLELIRLAAGRELATAQVELARRLERGDGVAADLTEAWVLYALAREPRAILDKVVPDKSIDTTADLARLEARMSPAQIATAQARFEARRPEPVTPGKDRVRF